MNTWKRWWYGGVSNCALNRTPGSSIFIILRHAHAHGDLVLMTAPSFLAAHTQCKAQLASVLIMQYYIWPISNWINFAYVPESLRVLFSNLVAVFWNAFLCTRIA